MKTYIKPKTTIFITSVSNIIADSYGNSLGRTCSEWCIHWDYCIDRQVGRYCRRKKYEYEL